MNNEEARFILSAYRPGGYDAGDPEFQAALAQAARDPELTEWFREQQGFDRSVALQLQQLTPPAGLKAGILAGARVSRKVTWLRPVRAIVAIAAVVAALAIILPFFMQESRFAGWQKQAIEFLDGTVLLDVESSNVAEIQQWLRDRDAPGGEFALPPRLASLPPVGCKTLFWNGQPVSIICFHLKDGALVHLVITKRDPASGAKTEPRFASSGRWNTVTWARGDEAVMLATLSDREALKQLL